jgi:hypothetical protein
MAKENEEKQPDYIVAHDFSIRHEKQIMASDICGCFYCRKIFKPSDIVEWIDESEEIGGGRTAMCPKCGIDSVIGSASGYPITVEFLKKMQRKWF